MGRALLSIAAALLFVARPALAQEKGGEDETGPYEVVANWPQPWSAAGYIWGSQPAVFAESPDRIFIGARGEIKAPEKLVFIVSFSDAQGGVTRHPASPGWPRYILSTVTFSQAAGRTNVQVSWVPHDATEEERRIFDEGRPSMTQGWGGTLDQLEAYLKA